MIPYATFSFVELIFYPVCLTLLLGGLRRDGRWWKIAVTLALTAIFASLRKTDAGREVWMLTAYGVWQYAVLRLYQSAGAPRGLTFYSALAASLSPLVATRIWPVASSHSEIGFLGLSYVTFRALDVVFCLRDKVLKEISTADLLCYLFFFPTLSAGPIDRYRRFVVDLHHQRTRAEFRRDLDGAVQHFFRGCLYKFIIAALIDHYWLARCDKGAAFSSVVSYMYGYSFFLFFDFAGYSAFAIALSYLFGVHTPENFNRPFLAQNIRDFWNRWHMTLSFWFRDHIYMRFILAARKGNWLRGRNVTATAGFFLTFGFMGLWHGLRWQYILYGLYHATLLSGFYIYSEKTKRPVSYAPGMLRRAVSIAITFHCVCFGFLIFSGRLTAS